MRYNLRNILATVFVILDSMLRLNKDFFLLSIQTYIFRGCSQCLIHPLAKCLLGHHLQRTGNAKFLIPSINLVRWFVVDSFNFPIIVFALFNKLHNGIILPLVRFLFLLHLLGKGETLVFQHPLQPLDCQLDEIQPLLSGPASF